MRVPGDVVPALLQGHGAGRAGPGAAAAARSRGRPARDGAAGLTPQEPRPRAPAQRGAHGPCADLAPGRDRGQGRPRLSGARGSPRSGVPCGAGHRLLWTDRDLEVRLDLNLTLHLIHMVDFF
uniref:Uncharacterized protein n=3 Tax=Canis lupus TaxID=9612 RepID=A0A8C0N6P7_CANLF